MASAPLPLNGSEACQAGRRAVISDLTCTRHWRRWVKRVLLFSEDVGAKKRQDSGSNNPAGQTIRQETAGGLYSHSLRWNTWFSDMRLARKQRREAKTAQKHPERDKCDPKSFSERDHRDSEILVRLNTDHPTLR